MQKKAFNEMKLIIYTFISIIVSMGQSILLINRVYSDNLVAIFFIHILSCLPPLFFMEQLFNGYSRTKYITLLISIFSIFVFTVFPEQLIASDGIRTAVKVVGIMLPALLIMVLYYKEKQVEAVKN